MKTSIIASTLLVSLMAAAPMASAGRSYPGSQGWFYDNAKVTNVEPVYTQVRISDPREECWDEEVTVHDRGYTSATPLIVGGILGGVLGHQVGNGRGQDVATIAGTVLGGSMGRDYGHRSSNDRYATTETRTQCRTVDAYRWERELDGYLVTYRYRGEEFATQMDHDPGRNIRIKVAVSPEQRHWRR